LARLALKTSASPATCLWVSCLAQTTKKTMTGQDVFNSNVMTLVATEDLGGGLAVKATQQVRYNGETMEDRNSGDLAIEVSGGFGSVKMGQHTFISGSGYNPFASTHASVAPSGAMIGGKDTLSYTSPAVEGVSIGFATTFDQTAGLGKAGTGVRLNYSNGPLAIQYGSSTAETDVAATAGAKLVSLMAKYDAGMATVFVSGYEQKAGADGNGTTNPVKQEKGVGVGVSIPMGALTLKFGNMNRASTDTSSTVKDRSSLGIDYALSKRTTASAMVANDVPVNAGIKSTTSWVGINHSF